MSKYISQVNIDGFLDLWESGRRQTVESRKELIIAELQKYLQVSGAVFGKSYFSIHDYNTTEMLYVSENSKEVVGYDPEFMLENGTRGIIGITLPSHIEKMKPIVNTCWKFTHDLPKDHRVGTVANFDYVITNGTSGVHTRLLNQQIVAALDEDDKIWLCIGIYHDISHLKPAIEELEPASSFFVKKTNTQYIYNGIKGYLISRDNFTDKEVEIIQAYGQNKSSQQIAEELFISPLTVQTHRTNIYKKSGLKNINALRYFARTHFSVN